MESEAGGWRVRQWGDGDWRVRQRGGGAGAGGDGDRRVRQRGDGAGGWRVRHRWGL